MNNIKHVPNQQGEHLLVMTDLVTLKASSTESNGHLTFMEVLCPPGGGPAVLHRHEPAETFYVLSGQLTIITSAGPGSEEQRLVANAGDTVSLPSMIWHTFRNFSEAPVKFLATLAPSGHEEFFKEIGIPVADVNNIPKPDGPPTPEQIQHALQIIGKHMEIMPQ
jgi:mannose-6-phosphate isomerase-like protein (cupin superfamily)